MKVSILIPVYNNEIYLAQTVESALSQTWADKEIIIVDDGSTDSSVLIARSFLGKGVKVVEQKNGGACRARNRAFQESTGEYIQYLDGDDLLSPNKIADQLKQLNGKLDIVSNGRWGRFYTDDPLLEDIQWGPHIGLQKDHDPVSWLCCNHMSQTACWLTPRSLIESAGLWDESLSINQDGEFFNKVVGKSKGVLYCDSAKMYYRSKVPGSISSKTKEEKALRSLYQTCVTFEDILFSLERSSRTRLASANKYQLFVYSAFPKCPELVEAAEQKIEELGGSQWPPYRGGTLHNLLMDVFGWKFAAKLKHLIK